MTEDEAKTKWCPFARVVTYDQYASQLPEGAAVGMTAANKTSDGSLRVGAGCIGSACMAWRVTHDLVTPCAPEKPSYVEATGFCGLAGSPKLALVGGAS